MPETNERKHEKRFYGSQELPPVRPPDSDAFNALRMCKPRPAATDAPENPEKPERAFYGSQELPPVRPPDSDAFNALRMGKPRPADDQS